MPGINVDELFGTEPTVTEEVTGQGATDQVSTGADAQPETSTTEQPLTLAQVQKILEERDLQWERKFQSQMDKRESSIVKRLREQGAHAQQVADVAQKNGLTKEQAATLQRALMDEAVQSALKENDETTQQQPAPNGMPTEEQITAQAMSLAQRYGLTAADEEVKLIKNTGTLEEYFDSIREAGIRRQLRIEVEKKGNPRRSPGVTPNGQAAAKAAFGMSRSDMLEAEIQRMKK